MRQAEIIFGKWKSSIIIILIYCSKFLLIIQSIIAYCDEGYYKSIYPIVDIDKDA